LKKITGVYWFFISIFFLILLIITNVRAQNPEVWAESPPIFTIAKTESVNIYVKNTEAIEENYNITFSISTIPEAHLINVYLPINRTKKIKPGDVGSVLARVTILGPISLTPTITFTATSDAGFSETSDPVQLMTGSPINLPEFGLIGMIQLLILSLLLVVSYPSHFR